MKIVKKFKDFFKIGKPEETMEQRLNRIESDINKRIKSIKEEISDLFYDFEDLGAEVDINPTYKNFLNEGPQGYLKITIMIKSKNVKDIDDNLPSEIRRCLIEAAFRMNEIEGAQIERADYNSEWSSISNFRSHQINPIRYRDIIMTSIYQNSNVDEVINSSWAKDYFVVKMWTKKDSNKLDKLHHLFINIYTRPIKPDPKDTIILADE